MLKKNIRFFALITVMCWAAAAGWFWIATVAQNQIVAAPALGVESVDWRSAMFMGAMALATPVLAFLVPYMAAGGSK